MAYSTVSHLLEIMPNLFGAEKLSPMEVMLMVMDGNRWCILMEQLNIQSTGIDTDEEKEEELYGPFDDISSLMEALNA